MRRGTCCLSLVILCGTAAARGQESCPPGIGQGARPTVLAPSAYVTQSPYTGDARRTVYFSQVPGGTQAMPVGDQPPAASQPPSLPPGQYYYYSSPGLIRMPRVTTWRPVIALSPPQPAYTVGRGLIGQPKLYVPGQPLRNFLRYISP